MKCYFIHNLIKSFHIVNNIRENYTLLIIVSDSFLQFLLNWLLESAVLLLNSLTVSKKQIIYMLDPTH